MPTVLRIGSFRFHFYSDEGQESAHIHVRTPDGECKFWLEPVSGWRSTEGCDRTIYGALSSWFLNIMTF